MSRDEVVSVALVVSFALLVTAQLLIVAGLASRRPRWRALVALAVPPFAPVWAWRAKMTGRALAWMVGGVAYGVTLWLASR